MLPFHPIVTRWFEETFAAPTPVQAEGWAAIASGSDALLAAPTGSGKTLAAFLWAIDEIVRKALAGTLEDRIEIVYVSPLKALGNDIERNLQGPLAGIRKIAEEAGTALPDIRVAVRSGDTSARDRARQAKTPPHILITTPESLYILLTAQRSREALRHARTVLVDEIHAVAADKRGAHLALSLERLDLLAGRPLQRVGLSATQKPIEAIGELLVGSRAAPTIVDAGHRRAIDLSVEIPDFELGPIATHELRGAVLDRVAALVRAHRTTIVFVNTRRFVERVAHELGERLGKDQVAAHHGSLSRETRASTEAGLKGGAIPVVVATSSLELGIDVGHVDLVCHVGAPRSIATLLQRVGRSGHFLGAVPKGILFPLTRDELVQCAAAIRAVRAGELDRIAVRENARDILAQQIVAISATGEIGVEDLWALVRRTRAYRDFPRAEFDAVVEMLSEGISTQRGRRGALIHLDRVNGVVRGRRNARLTAITGGGAIPDTADYDVIEEPAGGLVGKVHEDFAIEAMAGDVFQLGNRSWKIVRVEAGKVRVADATGLAATMPFWIAEAPGRTRELSEAVSDLRTQVAERLTDPAAAASWLVAEASVDARAAEQIALYVAESVAALGAVPTTTTLVAERFFDEAGGMQLVVHAPLGGRVNRALGLLLRKRFCVGFDFELQAAATDDGIVLSLGEQHSFPLDSVFEMLSPARIEGDLVQAVLVAPMFGNRWRWNATRALALQRHQNGKRVPMPIQRMRAEDLLAAVFPAQVACQDNHPGQLVEPPDHPLVNETIADCLHEAMDVDALRDVLERIARGEIRTAVAETAAPSPFSHEILNANPYAFLDDAPLEERRARAVSLRRTDPALASGTGALDPDAVAEVRRQAWPEPRDPDELHDELLSLVILPESEAGPWRAHVEALVTARRATRSGRWIVAAERAAWVRLAFPEARFDPTPPQVTVRTPEDGDDVIVEIVRGWMDALGPTTAQSLATRLGVEQRRIEAALLRLEGQGVVLQGRFGSTDPDPEWCERGLLARIHRMTIGRLRREIEPVPASDFLRFLFRWQHAAPGTQLHGKDGVRRIVERLGGLELPAPAWERDVLPARIADYDPWDLEQLCLAGEVAWGRLSVDADRAAPGRSAPLAFFLRDDLPDLLEAAPADPARLEGLSAPAREVFAHLERRGASFLAEIARAARRLPTEVEDALWELVACGLATGDGVAGLRTLLLPEEKRQPRRHLRALPGRTPRRLAPVGRWSLLVADPGGVAADDVASAGGFTPPERAGGRGGAGPVPPRRDAERVARRLLARWGVVLRELTARERRLPPWRSVLQALRRMEARGEVRGGRFVQGFVGEQFALPEAVDAMRAIRRRGESGELVLVAAADPLNLVGILTPGARVPLASGSLIAFRDGVPVEIGERGALRSRLQTQIVS